VLYQYRIPLPPIVARHEQSLECGGKKGSIFYFQYLDPQQAQIAEDLASRLLRGRDNGPSIEHPSRLLRFGNVMAVISFRDSAGDVDHAVEAALKSMAARESHEIEQGNNLLANDSGDLAARVALGKVLLDAGKPDQALLEFKEAERRGWKNSSADAYVAHALTVLGHMYRRQENHPAALAALQTAVMFDRDDAEANTVLADEYAENSQAFADGIEYLKRFVQADSHTPTETAVAYYSLGRIYTETKQEKDAMEAYEQALKANPNDHQVLNNLAWLYASAADPKLRQPARSVEYATRAVEISGRHDANYLDTLAEAYYANGQADKAVEAIKSAMALQPGNRSYKERLQKFEIAASTMSQR
jgi:tetratricopeptide (TPR) repeat protein